MTMVIFAILIILIISDVPLTKKSFEQTFLFPSGLEDYSMNAKSLSDAKPEICLFPL